jgi:hypothetical protein
MRRSGFSVLSLRYYSSGSPLGASDYDTHTANRSAMQLLAGYQEPLEAQSGAMLVLLGEKQKTPL